MCVCLAGVALGGGGLLWFVVLGEMDDGVGGGGGGGGGVSVGGAVLRWGKVYDVVGGRWVC